MARVDRLDLVEPRLQERVRLGVLDLQALITYTAEPGSASETALRLLASWSATEERLATP